MTSKLDQMWSKLTRAYPGVWRWPYVKKNGEEYYKYVFTYVDDLLLISKDPRIIMDDTNIRFNFNNDGVEEPTN